ncbi:EAL domain-containing protein [Paludibacterium paludis]|uniref:Diguanylate cyclase/phosphodiesterase with PAS/PAC sensor(S) n=1 Tax=Paludibacterium paludis TaxID=1225769 RepID=A0A918U8F0_9NEIS|nr:EAL domain-containing protein [Paludibacterium paludis]GGY07201.1 hypothetical protein GCM10011289_07270 [Paludibacterium paludis]
MSPLQQTVEQILSPDILSCSPETSVGEAAAIMSSRGCGSIVVIDEAGTAVGIWTETDALDIDYRDPAIRLMPVSQLMSHPVLTVPHTLSLHEATALFRENAIRHALVTGPKGYHGMISLTDIVLNQGTESFIGLRRVETVDAPPVLIIDGSRSLPEAMQWMREAGRDALVVALDDGEYGIVTQRDVLRLVTEGPPDQPLGGLCSQPLVAVGRHTSLLQARRLLIARKIRHLGVVNDEGVIERLLGFSEILRSIEQEFMMELQQVLSERDKALLETRQNLLLADKVFESTLDGIMITDGDGIIQSVNPAFCRITGYGSGEVIGKTPRLLNSGRQPGEFYEYFWRCLRQEGFWQGEMVNRRKNGLLYTEHLSVTAIRDPDGRCRHYVAVFSDITQRKQAEERLHFLANHDALTGLPNRTLFMERLQSAIDRASESGERLALLFIDLDRFKLVNDTLGHLAGDELLIMVAELLRERIPAHGTVARLSGDEFILLIENVESVRQVAGLAQSLTETMSSEKQVSGQNVFVSASIGISLYPDDGTMADILLGNADAAMYRAKERGKNTFQFYTTDMNASALERLRLEYALHRALAQNEELEVWYQPKVALADGSIVGAEALVRWTHPELGPIAPDRFIAIAEESSLIGMLGEWVLATACSALRSWRERGLLMGRMAVNISGRQLKLGGIVETICRILDDAGVPHGSLELEVTESVAMEEGSGMIDVLHRLKEQGIYLSIDDFGTGYSSLAYLKRLPVSGLKIDRSFIMDLHRDSDDAAITAAIVSIAQSLGLDLVAEGVERVEQRDFLLGKGCTMAQGYFFSPPLPRAEFEALLVEQAGRRPCR